MKIFAASVGLLLLIIGCNQKATNNENNDQVQAIFPKGEKGPAENFTGNAWNTGLVADDTIYNILNREQEAIGILIRQDRY
jgi:hypothetical protein